MPVSVLSDGTIRRLVDEGRIVVKPWDPSLVQPASVDLRLGDSFRVFHNHRASAIDLRDGPPEGLTEAVDGHRGGGLRHPPRRVLPRPHGRMGRAAGRRRGADRGQVSLGRLGLIVHATAGFIDPGWKGTLTLELNNLTRVPIKLYPGLLIAQLSFMALDQPAERPYGSADSARTTRARWRPPRAATCGSFPRRALAVLQETRRRGGGRALQDAVLRRRRRSWWSSRARCRPSATPGHETSRRRGGRHGAIMLVGVVLVAGDDGDRRRHRHSVSPPATMGVEI